ncbi:MAG: hypothetical protein ACRDU5_00325 [Mycobacterium sp.]
MAAVGGTGLDSLFGVGVSQLLSQIFIVLAYRYASSVKLGPFVYTVIVFTALIDWVGLSQFADSRRCRRWLPSRVRVGGWTCASSTTRWPRRG